MATWTTSASSSAPREIVNVSASVSVACWAISSTILNSPPNAGYSARASPLWETVDPRRDAGRRDGERDAEPDQRGDPGHERRLQRRRGRRRYRLPVLARGCRPHGQRRVVPRRADDVGRACDEEGARAGRRERAQLLLDHSRRVPGLVVLPNIV